MPSLTHIRQTCRCTFLLTLALVGAAAPVFADPVISEFMASNVSTRADVDGDYSSWIELFNPDSAAVNLNGWYLAGKPTNLTKWKIPAVTLQPGGYLVIFASNKNYTDPTKELHTNFNLSTSDTFVALVKPDGVTISSAFNNFPQQFDDISYGVTQPTDSSPPRTGYLRLPSYDARNPDVIFLPDTVTLSRAPGLFTGSISLTMSGAAAGEKIYYVVAPPSSANGAAVAEPTSTSTLYTGPITVSSTVIVRAEIFSTDNKSRGLPATAQFVQLGATAASFSTSLPVMILDEHGLGPLAKDSVYHPAWLYVFTPSANGPATLTQAPALATPMGMSVHGNFSANFPKKSWDLALQDTLGYNNKQPLLGLDNDRQWDLYGPWSTDRSYIRNAYVYALSNRIGRWAPRTKFVETFVNNDNDGLTSADYYGIGVLIDRLKISSNRINITSIGNTDITPPGVTGGYIFKMDPTPDLTHYNFVTDHNIPSQNLAQGTTGFIVESPDAGSLKPAQQAYVRSYIQTMENSLFSARANGYTNRSYLDYIDVPSWVDHHLMQVFVGNVDALYHSSYFYKDQGGKLIAGPLWDYDGSSGDGDPRCANPNTWDTTGGRDLWNYDWWGQITHDPEFMQAWIDRWQTLRRNEFATANLTSLADSLAAQIPADAAARDAVRWPDNVSQYPGGFLGEVAHLKDWFSQRAAWIDSQFTAPPTITASGSTLTVTPVSGTQLAYTTDGTDPRALGGALALNARLSSAAVTVPNTVDLQVRTYIANFNGSVFPGSPWSSAVGGPKSSVVTPRPRLANLSSRGLASTGENVMIAGIVVRDTAGKQYLARAVGPALTAFGVSGALADPVLTILDANGKTIAANSAWQSGPDAATLPDVTTAVGAFPLAKKSNDAALLASLAKGQYTLQVSSASGGSGVSLVELYEVDNAAGRTLNLSTRGLVQAGNGLLIGGVVVSGTSPKRLLIRAVGPTLAAFGVTSALADPVLTFYSGTTAIATNDAWSNGASGAATAADISAAATAVGAFALNAASKDSALLLTLAPGAYTAQVTSKGTDAGVILFEIYEVP